MKTQPLPGMNDIPRAWGETAGYSTQTGIRTSAGAGPGDKIRRVASTVAHKRHDRLTQRGEHELAHSCAPCFRIDVQHPASERIHDFTENVQMPDVITVMTVTFQSEAKAALRDAIMINRSDTPDTAHPGGQGGIAPVCAGKKTLQPRRRRSEKF